MRQDDVEGIGEGGYCLAQLARYTLISYTIN
jgi:hypothetical protein